MECRKFRNHVESFLKKDNEIKLGNRLQQHLRTCNKCRDKYLAVLSAHTSDSVIPQLPKMHGTVPLAEAQTDHFSDPIEFKDTPLSFTLHMDGRKEAIKVVEPEMDVPLPENGQLVVAENGIVRCEVRFAFNPHSDRPYELHFNVLMGVTYAAENLVAFGIPLDEDEELLSRYEMEIVARGGLKAWIKMTQGKARLFIKYKEAVQFQ
jgi:hypothetical protein